MIISPSATLSCGTMSSGSEWEPSSRSFTMRTSSSVRAAGRACVIRQVERAQKCVPEGFPSCRSR